VGAKNSSRGQGALDCRALYLVNIEVFSFWGYSGDFSLIFMNSLVCNRVSSVTFAFVQLAWRAFMQVAQVQCNACRLLTFLTSNTIHVK
jgi:hypothetical protein